MFVTKKYSNPNALYQHALNFRFNGMKTWQTVVGKRGVATFKYLCFTDFYYLNLKLTEYSDNLYF